MSLESRVVLMGAGKRARTEGIPGSSRRQLVTLRILWDFPGGPVVRTPCFHCQEYFVSVCSWGQKLDCSGLNNSWGQKKIPG